MSDFYSKFKYGADTYGYGTVSPNLIWSVIIAWNGYYSGYNEANNMIGFSCSRGRDFVLQANGTGFQHYDIGEATMVFDNSSGRYDPYNGDSPIYPNVTPGKFIRIAVMYNGTTYGIMRGKISDIQPFNQDNRQCVRITATDGLRWLQDKTTYAGLQTAQDVDYCIGKVLDDVSWPNTEWPRNFSSSSDTLNYWWAWQKNAMQAINELQDAEAGTFWHDKNGTARFVNRQYTMDNVTVLGQAEILQDIIIPQPWEVLRNNISVYSNPKVVAGSTTLFTLQDKPAIINLTTYTLKAFFKYNNNEAACASPGFSFTVNTQADGLGVNLTPACTLTYTTPTGSGAIISIRNASGFDGYITSLVVTGIPIYVADSSIRTRSDTTSITAYGIKDLTINTPWVADTEKADVYAEYLLNRYKHPNFYPVIQVENRPVIQFINDLFKDTFLLTAAKYNIASTYFRIGRIEHTWLNENGQAVRTMFKLEPYIDPATGYWEFTTSLGVTSAFNL